MARVLELTTRMNAVKRSNGDSATARAAYRACCVIDCERQGKRHDYRRKGGLELAEIVLPDDAPEWAADRAKLWNAAELRETNKDKRAKSKEKANAQLARDYLFAFPDELSAAGRRGVARTIALHLVEVHGVAVDFAIHQPGKDGDHRNHHCHMMFTTRRMTAKGLGEKAREWDERDRAGSDRPNLAHQLRAFVAKTLNDALKAEGQENAVFVEHRTYKARGSGQIATRHQGPKKTHALRNTQDRARKAWIREQQAAQLELHTRDLTALTQRQEAARQHKMAELVRRGQQGEAAIRRELEQARAADLTLSRAQRAFLTVTGRAGGEAFERQTREAQRIQDAERKLDALKNILLAERNAFLAEQKHDREQLAQRHQRDEKQLQQAIVRRHGMDRTTEIHARHELSREWARTLEREQERSRGIERSGPAPR